MIPSMCDSPARDSPARVIPPTRNFPARDSPARVSLARDSLVRVAVGIGDVEVWQRALDFLSFGAFQVSEREWAGEAYFARYHIERMVLLQASHVREVIHSTSVVRL